MPHTPLIATLVAAIVLAFGFGVVANRLRISPLVGYLLAGVAVGPYTPGFVANQALASQLADIGVILLMFGVGLQFSPRELFSVKAIAVPGAIIQIAVAAAAGWALGVAMGWPGHSSIVLGLSLSVASTVVVIRALDERRLLDSEAGHISVGWLVVEDLVMVLAIVLLPTLAGFAQESEAAPQTGIWAAVAIALGKAFAFVAVMLVVGPRIIPWAFHSIAQSGSRELFRLGVLALALGVAFGAAELVGVSFALGAFFAGLVLSESALSQRAAAEALPLRDAFAVLFFVSVGMLFDPGIFMREPWAVAATLVVIVAVKPGVAFGVTWLFGYPLKTSLAVAASRCQIGEFSFILASLGVTLGLLSQTGRDLVLAGAILSIVATPLFLLVAERLQASPPLPAPDEVEGAAAMPPARPEPAVPTLADHNVLIGGGRVGRVLLERLGAMNEPVLVVEEHRDQVEALRARGVDVVHGHAPSPEVFRTVNLAEARRLFIAIPDGFEAGQVAEQARALNPTLEIVARAHSDAEAEHMRMHGADLAIVAERELANAMLRQIFAGGGPGMFRTAANARDREV